MPKENLFGVDTSAQVGKKAKEWGAKKALIICGSSILKTGYVERIIGYLKEEEIDTVLYSNVSPNPTDSNVAEGVSLLQQAACDLVVAIGGGSSLDCAKAIALVAANGGTVYDYEGIDKSAKEMVPLITINTTAGTASEMTRISVITNTKEARKMIIVDKNITPKLTINDPALMVSLSPEFTAGTGMDALTHAIEAYVSTLSNPITDANAFQAIRLIGQYLPQAVKDGENIEARTQMACAQFLAGMAFNNALLGNAHALAHPLGSIYDLPHGLCNAILLPYVMNYNLQTKPDKFRNIALALGVNVAGVTVEEAAELSVKAVRELAKQIGIPERLSVIGVKEEDLPKLAEMASKDPCALFNPRPSKYEDLLELLKTAY